MDGRIRTFEKKLDFNSNIRVVYELTKFNWLFGLKKFSLKNDKFIGVGKFYKSYTTILALSLLAGSIWFSKKNIQLTMESNSPPLVVTFSVSQYSLLLQHVIMVLHSVFFGSKISTEFCSSIRVLDEKLDYIRKDQNIAFKKNLIAYTILYWCFKISQILFTDLIWIRYSLKIFHISSTTADLGAFHFIVDVGLVARRFELLNRKLKSIYMKTSIRRSSCMYLKGGLLTSNWLYPEKSTEELNVEKSTKYGELKVEELLQIFNELSDAIDLINECYGLTLFLLSMTMLTEFLLTINIMLMWQTLAGLTYYQMVTSSIGWSMWQSLRIIVITAPCEILAHEIEKTKTILNKFLLSNGGDELEAVERFIRLLLDRDLGLKALLFKIDFEFIGTLVGTLISYSFILQQMS